MMEVMLTNGAERWQSSSQIVTTNKLTPGFLQARCPYYHAANSVRKALNGVFQACLWPLEASGYLGRWLLSFPSAL